MLKTLCIVWERVIGFTYLRALIGTENKLCFVREHQEEKKLDETIWSALWFRPAGNDSIGRYCHF